jgi:dolichol kinase
VSPGALRLGTLYLAATAVLLEVVRLRVPAVRQGLAAVVPVYRERERQRPSGAMWLALGYAVTAWVPPHAAVAGILAGGLADPAGAVVGSSFGGGAPKSRPGSLAVALTAALAVRVSGTPWTAAAVAGAVAAIVERWSAPIDDNLMVAPAVGLAVALLA